MSRRFEEVVQLLFHKEIKSKLVDGDRWHVPRLHILAACGSLAKEGEEEKKEDMSDSIEGLLISGANINEVDKYSLTPIHYAIRFNEDSYVVKYLLDNGADIVKE